jgi:uncharacterized protein (TIGR02266 family)
MIEGGGMAEREPIVLPVRFAVGNKAFQVTTRALTLEGAFLRCSEPQRAGTSLALRIYFPAGSPFDVSGRVDERLGPSSEAGFWVRFDLVAPQLRERIAKLLGGSGPQAPGQAPAPAKVPKGGIPAARTGVEARCTARVEARLRVQFRTAAALRREMSVNISAGGLFIETDQPPPMRELVLVSIELPAGSSGEQRPIEVQAEIVHRVTPDQAKATGRPAGVGVQFVGGDDSFRERLDAFLARSR